MLSAVECLALFQRLRRDSLPATAPERTIKGVKAQSVQAFVSLFLADILAAVGGHYKVLSEQVLHPLTGRPDHVIVRVRDTFVDISNVLVLFEDKRTVGVLEDINSPSVKLGSLEAIGYAISRTEHVSHLFPTASEWTSFAVFTNGLSVRIFRITLTKDGTASVLATPLLPLFCDVAAPAAAPAGFEALVRLLSATPEQLQDTVLPPNTLQCTLAGRPLQLGERLGVGGFTNVYACNYDGQAAVVKSAELNIRTPLERAGLAAEGSVLRTLNAARCPCVPLLLAEGDRTDGNVVPFLLIAPRGVLHGDVRPSNVVVLSGSAMLVDWGASLALDGATLSHKQGVMLFAASPVALAFDVDQAATWTADASVDLEPVAYLYAAVALGSQLGCSPLWNYGQPVRRGGPLPPLALLSPSSASVAGMCAARANWLQQHRAELGEGVFDFLRRVQAGETPYDFTFV